MHSTRGSAAPPFVLRGLGGFWNVTSPGMGFARCGGFGTDLRGSVLYFPF